MAGSAPSDNVFIGDLPAAITQQEVETIFAGYGSIVQCRVMAPKGPGAKASALVRFSSVDESTWVVSSLNGNLAEGLDEPIIVRFANAPGGAKGGKKGGGGCWGKDGSGWQEPAPAYGHAGKGAPGGGGPTPGDNVFIGDLPAHITTTDVESIFSGYGTIVQCRVNPPKAEGMKASALVRFSNADEAAWVVSSLNGNLAEGLDDPVQCRFANAPGGKGKDSGKGGYGPAIGATARAEPYGGKGAPAPPWRGSPDVYAAAGKGAGKAPAPSSARALHQAIKGAGVLGGGHVPNECQVYVKNLPLDASDVDLYRIFSPFGALAVSGAKAMMEADGSCKGFGFVDFIDPLSAQAAVDALSGFTLPDGSSIGCSIKFSQKEGKGGKGGKDGKGF